MSSTTKSRAAVTKLLDAINNENFQVAPDNNSVDDTVYVVKKVSVEQCSPWKFANRMKKFVDEESCRDLIESIKLGGQKIPAIARKIPNTNQYEVLCGIRRLYTCRILKTPILIAVVNVNDKEALLIMDVENRSRVDISPYERAIDYKNWIDCGVYKNHKEIQELTGIKKSWFSQLMALTELHPDIVDVFGHPKNLKQKWGYNLRALCKDKTFETKMLEVVTKIKTKKYHPRTIYSKLLKSCSSDNTQNTEVIVKDANDKMLLKTIRPAGGGLNIFIKKHLEEYEVTKIIERVKVYLSKLDKKK